MNNQKKAFRLIIFSGCLFVTGNAVVLGQGLQLADLNSQIVEMSVSKASLDDVLFILAIERRIPIGFERSALETREITIEVDRITLKELLDLIVKQAGLYRWELREGVINFVPVRGRDPLLRSLLSTRIIRYAPKKGANKFDLRNTLADLTELKLFLAINKLTVPRLSDYAYYPSIHSNSNVDLRISDTDVRGVLNKIARESEHNLWFVQWSNQKKREVMLGY